MSNPSSSTGTRKTTPQSPFPLIFLIMIKLTLLVGTYPFLKADNGPIAIQYEHYAESFFFLAFSFGEEANYGEFFSEKKIGNCDMSIKLRANTNSTIKILLYVQYQEIISVDQNRNIIRDFVF